MKIETVENGFPRSPSSFRGPRSGPIFNFAFLQLLMTRGYMDELEAKEKFKLIYNTVSGILWMEF